MILRYFYDEYLAHASYLAGCPKTGEAIVIDPSRNVDQYIQTAKSNGLEITASAETHIHADFVSGTRELEARTGAKIYLSDEGGTNSKYENLINVNHRLIKDGDTFNIGDLTFEVMHTPGHTPESISFLLTDSGSGAEVPMGIFTGDFIFAGDVGRPDLLEKAAGYEGTAEQGAKEMFFSIGRFKQLPDYLQVCLRTVLEVPVESHWAPFRPQLLGMRKCLTRLYSMRTRKNLCKTCFVGSLNLRNIFPS